LLRERVFGKPLAISGLPLCSLLRERTFGKPLASNGLPLWLHYSGFQASCHNIYFLFIVYLTTLYSFDYIASNRRLMMNSELERLWKEEIVA
jgi:hypothetical protein